MSKYKKINKNKIKFEKLISKIQNAQFEEEKIKIAQKAIGFAIGNGTGYYSSYEIEKVFLDIAESIDVNTENCFKKEDSFLHVMSETYTAGGHTRVVERWIENSPEHQIHSLITTRNEKKEIPSRLETAVLEKAGTLYRLEDELTYREKGTKLRSIALGYTCIVLHIHMDDFIPLIAFGSEKFNTPIIFYNHADHVFWVGVTIADIVADIKTQGSILTLKRRGAKRSYVLGVPIDQKRAIHKNGLNYNRKIQKDRIVLTIGSAYKYKPIGNLNFLEIAFRLIKENEDIAICAVGPSPNELMWKKAYRKSKGRIKAFGVVDNNLVSRFYKQSDLVIDSIPMGGGTACIDAITNGKPVFTLNNPFGQFDYLLKSSGYCKSQEDLIKKVLSCLENERFKETILEEQIKGLEELTPKNWIKELDDIIKELPQYHKINHEINKNREMNFTESDLWISLIHSPKWKKIIKRLMELLISGNISELKRLADVYVLSRLRLGKI